MVDYDAVRRLAYENARSCREMVKSLVELRKANGLTRADVDERMGMWLSPARWVESNPTDVDMNALRAYASAVGARLTFTVEADPDVEAGA